MSAPLLAVPDLELSVGAGESAAVVGESARALWKRLAGAPDRAPGPVLYKGKDISGWSAARRREAGLLALFEAPRAPAGMTLAALLRSSFRRAPRRGLRAALREAARGWGVPEELLEAPLDEARWRPFSTHAEWLQAVCLGPDLVVSAARPLKPALESLRALGSAVVLTAQGPSA